MEADVGNAYNHMVLGKLPIFLLVEVDQQLFPDAPTLKSKPQLTTDLSLGSTHTILGTLLTHLCQ